MKWRSLEEAKPGLGYATLAAALDERRALMQKYVPAEIQAENRRAVEELRASRMMERILGNGAVAPEFELPDQDGKLVCSAALLAKGPLVMLFFRGRWCPFCVAQLEAWSEVLPQVRTAGAEVVAVSPQTVHQSSLMRDQHKLGPALLSDIGNNAARQFGLVYRVPDYQQRIYSRTFVNLPFVNGDASWELPLPATYGIAADGRIVYASADPDYTRRPEPVEVLRSIS